jgi:hypothetical protein
MGSTITDGAVATSGSLAPITWRQVITDALVEIGSYDYSDTPSAAHIELGRRYLNGILDSWKAQNIFAYSATYAKYTLTAARQPHKIGPGLSSPDFAADMVPSRITNAAIVVGSGTTEADYPLDPIDSDEWKWVQNKQYTEPVPTQIYYTPLIAYGEIYLQGIPSYAYGIRMELLNVITEIPAGSLYVNVSIPSGYRKAIKLTLAEEICRPMGREKPGDLIRDAARARTTIMMANT